MGARRLGGPVPLEESVTQGKVCVCFSPPYLQQLDVVPPQLVLTHVFQGGLLMDNGLFVARSFRVGWGPGWTLAHCGIPLSTSTSKQLQHQELTSKTDFSFLPKPARTKP